MFNIKRLITTGLLYGALLSCTPFDAATVYPVSNPTIGADGYTFEATSFTTNQARITIVRHDSFESIREAWDSDERNNRRIPDASRILGFTYYEVRDGISICTLHIMDPRINYRPEIIGHELMHCMHGNFHPGR